MGTTLNWFNIQQLNWFKALDHVFHTDITAYCQQNCYVRLAIYTDLFTLNYNFFKKWLHWHLILKLTKLIIITIITTSRICTKIRVDFNVTVGAPSKEYIAMYCSINQSLDRLWEIAWRTGSNTIISVSKVRRWSRSNRLMINIRIY